MENTNIINELVSVFTFEIDFQFTKTDMTEIIHELHSNEIKSGIEDMLINSYKQGHRCSYVVVYEEKTQRFVLVHEGFEDLIND